MNESDISDGHSVFQGGKILPDRCHCDRGRAHAVADDEQSAYGVWILPGAGEDIKITGNSITGGS